MLPANRFDQEYNHMLIFLTYIMNWEQRRMTLVIVVHVPSLSELRECSPARGIHICILTLGRMEIRIPSLGIHTCIIKDMHRLSRNTHTHPLTPGLHTCTQKQKAHVISCGCSEVYFCRGTAHTFPSDARRLKNCYVNHKITFWFKFTSATWTLDSGQHKHIRAIKS